MNLTNDKNQSLVVILYSSLFILTTEALLIKISPQAFSLFFPLPLLFVGLCLNYRDFFLSVFLSFFILLVASIFFNSFLQKSFIFFYFIISSIIILFFGIPKIFSKFKINTNLTITFINLFFVMLIAIFQFLFFNTLDKFELKSYLLKIITETIKIYKLDENIDINELVDFFILLLPSINSIVFLITFSLNFMLTNYFVKKSSFIVKNKIVFRNNNTPKWFSILYVISLTTYFILGEESYNSIFFLNSFICMSFNYLFEGFDIFNKYFKRIEINNFLKFLLIFLLFLFLGYLLLLILLLLGYIKNIKKFIRV